MSTDARTRERLRHHFEVEKELAERLRQSTRAERPRLFRTLYDELFARVPDHPRLTRRETPESTRRAVAARMTLLDHHLQGVQHFLEIAPGDCRLAFEVCRRVGRVTGVDISDQSGASAQAPSNFKLIVYDGYQLDLPAESVDLAFSYQFLEHLHPDDVEGHFQLVHRLLKPGGAYIFSTPHRFSGPHDISSFFTPTPQGFHLKEWTYGELTALVRRLGFSAAHPYRFGRVRPGLTSLNLGLENLAGILPDSLRRAVSQRLFLNVILLARK